MADTAKLETFTYAAPTDSAARRIVIRAIERATGQPHLKRLYLEFQQEQAGAPSADDFFAAGVKKLRLDLSYDEAKLMAAPRTGPLVIVANHPFGVLDGIAICHMMLKLRRDFRILTNSALYRVPEIYEWLLPVDFTETQDALDTNIKTRAEARRYLAGGGALVIFPSGGVATTPSAFARRAIDAEWKPLTARLILQGKAPVLPIFFHGQNSRLFQIVSQFSMTLRLALIFREVHRRIGTRLPVSIGDVIPFERLAAMPDKKAVMTYLRQAVEALEDRA
ncbi:MAG: lysophospholipid acyltransferase family protein [Alphaproteobacteria bacterium]|nr:lysophospholipid acyltransferase family protein [Alphaproteobacteria bacterium]